MSHLLIVTTMNYKVYGPFHLLKLKKKDKGLLLMKIMLSTCARPIDILVTHWWRNFICHAEDAGVPGGSWESGISTWRRHGNLYSVLSLENPWKEGLMSYCPWGHEKIIMWSRTYKDINLNMEKLCEKIFLKLYLFIIIQYMKQIIYYLLQLYFWKYLAFRSLPWVILVVRTLHFCHKGQS